MDKKIDLLMYVYLVSYVGLSMLGVLFLVTVFIYAAVTLLTCHGC